MRKSSPWAGSSDWIVTSGSAVMIWTAAAPTPAAHAPAGHTGHKPRAPVKTSGGKKTRTRWQYYWFDAEVDAIAVLLVERGGRATGGIMMVLARTCAEGGIASSALYLRMMMQQQDDECKKCSISHIVSRRDKERQDKTRQDTTRHSEAR
jgi:hypothetical protein